MSARMPTSDNARARSRWSSSCPHRALGDAGRNCCRRPGHDRAGRPRGLQRLRRGMRGRHRRPGWHAADLDGACLAFPGKVGPSISGARFRGVPAGGQEPREMGVPSVLGRRRLIAPVVLNLAGRRPRCLRSRAGPRRRVMLGVFLTNGVVASPRADADRAVEVPWEARAARTRAAARPSISRIRSGPSRRHGLRGKVLPFAARVVWIFASPSRAARRAGRWVAGPWRPAIGAVLQGHADQRPRHLPRRRPTPRRRSAIEEKVI